MTRLFPTKYGHFSPDGREYVITRPETPKPWINVICPGEYGVAIAQSGTGYSWLTHASFNRVTRWEQDLIRDEWGRFLYCRDRDTGDVWSLGWQPVRAAFDAYECRHGIGYTTITQRVHGVESEHTTFVPPDEPLEVWRVRLHNRSRRTRRLDLFTYFEWNLGPAPDTHREFHRLFIETEYATAAQALLATKRLNTIVPRGSDGEPWNVAWPHVAFHACSVRPQAWESDKQAFLGQYGTMAAPRAVREGRLTRTTGRWHDGIGSLQAGVTLRPGAETEVAFTLGVASTRAEALRLTRRYRTSAAVERGFRAMRAHWDALLAPLAVKTPDRAFDVLTNTWLPYQAISGRLRGRSAFYQTGGAFGFRDQLQDAQVYLPLAPEHTRRQILLHAAHQFRDGTTYHWWHPITEVGAKKPYNDDLLWLPFVTLNYLRETGDFSILDARVPFLAEDGAPSHDVGTLYEHCRRAIDSLWPRLSPRGIPRMGAGDWNDGLSAIGKTLRSESVWLAHFLVGILDGWGEMEARRTRPDHACVRRYARAARAMRRAVNARFWDGDWYVRATKDDGSAIGSRRNRDGRIYLNAQTWAILHDVVPARRLPRMLRAMRRHLYGDYGPLLLAPAYHAPDASIGYLTRYAPGSRENGGLYTHAATWAVQAECKLGRAAAAWELYRRFSPILRGRRPDFYAAEPYVTPGNVDGPDSPHYGRGGWTWYTGSAAWLCRVSTEWMLGVRPTWDGLLIEPCIPRAWRGFMMTRRFRGCTYRIRVRAHARRAGVLLDGVELRRPLLPPCGAGCVHDVRVDLA